MGLFSGFSGSSARKKRHHGNGSGYYKQQSGMGGLFGGIMGSFGSGSSARRHRGGFGFGSLSSSKRRHAGYGTPYPAQQAVCAGRSADRLGEQRFDLPELSRRRSGRGKILPRVRHETRRRVLRPVRRHAAPDRQILP